MNRAVAENLAKLKLTYRTSDPFRLCDFLNVDVRWVDMERHPLGKTAWVLGESLVLLDQSIRDDSRRYFVCAHELGHLLSDKGFAGYYIANQRAKSSSERNADAFAASLIYSLYVEEHDGEQPDLIQELSADYGLPIEGQDYLLS
ncbi:ImmA/IrrE family metallo-endopeptidase [Loigolactobacillus bifermentans]|jgi:Zn-dependent peptidase ImmA (M78 family)|uniref:IrrE N-terminal-like domain-containing protein n=1 Tax=Loigolactobacillus bifermentans DSM 20003 TaxID=1423726 RepID=A0A0R1HA60_9LACO|nr:ImmA/IrrE family metallo-endopeptidase [Loigolactobacillus bifermentans]KRK40849.1 hypothetical protein FC07_GL002601 [Loigolactobacillus bifermentans DSM 20003]QGG59602.1 hypothetical protein LB003_03400 [Loigolactobacillus bifermentans]